MNNTKSEPMVVALRNEIKVPVYIDLQNVRRTDGLSRFQAMSSSSSR